MPQMAPMNWMILFMSFVMIFIVCINKIFYISVNSFNPSVLNKTSYLPNLNLWKW